MRCHEADDHAEGATELASVRFVAVDAARTEEALNTMKSVVDRVSGPAPTPGQPLCAVGVDVTGDPFTRSVSDDACTPPEGSAVPLTENEYQVGLCIRTDHLVANFPDLITLSVSPGPNAGDHVPYPAADRGFVDLDVADKLLAVNSQ